VPDLAFYPLAVDEHLERPHIFADRVRALGCRAAGSAHGLPPSRDRRAAPIGHDARHGRSSVVQTPTSRRVLISCWAHRHSACLEGPMPREHGTRRATRGKETTSDAAPSFRAAA